jgi:peptide/nickel transport system permease protein
VTAVVPVPDSSRSEPLLAFARAYRADRGGVTGLAILLAATTAALAAPLFIQPRDLSVVDAIGPALAPPSAHYPLGTDQPGRSVLLLLIWGTRPSLAIGVTAAMATVALGSLFGLVAGHYGGVAGRVLMAITDWFIVLPGLPLAMVLAAVLGQGDASITTAIAITSWSPTARLIRAQTLAVEARPFVERAHALGASRLQVLARHVAPNVAPMIGVAASLTVATAILSETTLAFLGLGNPAEVSWGAMLNQALTEGAISRGAWWFVLPPGIAILIVVLGFALTGRAIERILNPRLAS